MFGDHIKHHWFVRFCLPTAIRPCWLYTALYIYMLGLRRIARYKWRRGFWAKDENAAAKKIDFWFYDVIWLYRLCRYNNGIAHVQCTLDGYIPRIAGYRSASLRSRKYVDQLDSWHGIISDPFCVGGHIFAVQGRTEQITAFINTDSPFGIINPMGPLKPEWISVIYDRDEQSMYQTVQDDAVVLKNITDTWITCTHTTYTIDLSRIPN